MAEGADHDPANPHSIAAGRSDGKGWFPCGSQCSQGQPRCLCSLSALSAPRPCLLPATRCIQQAAYSCPAGTMLVFFGTSTAPLSTALPGSTGLHCGAPNRWPQPRMPQSHQLKPLHQPPTDRCHLPVANAQVSGSPPTLPHLGRVLAHLWRDLTCRLQPWDSWFSKAPNTRMRAHTHTHTRPCSLWMPNHWVRPLCLDGSRH